MTFCVLCGVFDALACSDDLDMVFAWMWRRERTRERYSLSARV